MQFWQELVHDVPAYLQHFNLGNNGQPIKHKNGNIACIYHAASGEPREEGHPSRRFFRFRHKDYDDVFEVEQKADWTGLPEPMLRKKVAYVLKNTVRDGASNSRHWHRAGCEPLLKAINKAVAPHCVSANVPRVLVSAVGLGDEAEGRGSSNGGRASGG